MLACHQLTKCRAHVLGYLQYGGFKLATGGQRQGSIPFLPVAPQLLT